MANATLQELLLPQVILRVISRIRNGQGMLGRWLDAPRPDPVAQPGSDSADRYLMLFDRLAGEVRASQKARRGAYAGAGTLPVPATQPLS